jgi:hypothetical protein
MGISSRETNYHSTQRFNIRNQHTGWNELRGSIPLRIKINIYWKNNDSYDTDC